VVLRPKQRETLAVVELSVERSKKLGKDASGSVLVYDIRDILVNPQGVHRHLLLLNCSGHGYEIAPDARRG
jgi:hypothetical protein